MMSSSVDPTSELPAVDERLVAPESGYDFVDGKVVPVPPADEPHGNRHSKVNALLEAYVAEGYDAASDMLTRTSKTDDIAPDASVYPAARDARTGGRQLEVMAFEVVATQALSKAGDKARRLCARGVRRVFALDVSRKRVLEWDRAADNWQVLPDSGAIDDDCLVGPLRVEALVKAARADDAVAQALLAKNNPVLVEALEERLALGRQEGRMEGREEGREEGRTEGQRDVLTRLLTHRFGALTPEDLARVQQLEGAALDAAIERALAASSVADVLGP